MHSLPLGCRRTKWKRSMANKMLIMAHYKNQRPISWPWPNFSPAELASNGNGAVQIQIQALDRLQALRTEWNRSLTINSAYRDPVYNLKIGSTNGSQHPKGTAFDVSVRGWTFENIYLFKEMAYKHGFRGFGGYEQKNGDRNFIHIDNRGSRAKWGKDWAWPNAYLWVEPAPRLPAPPESRWKLLFCTIADIFKKRS